MGEVTYEPETTKESDGRFWKPIFISIAAILLVRVLETWIYGPFAAFIAVSLLGLVFYWIPPKPKLPYGRWIFHLMKWATLAFIAVTVYELLLKPLLSIAHSWFET